MHEIQVKADLLADNAQAAQHNREHFTAHGIYVVNLMNAPGAGKTTLLEHTLAALAGRLRLGVIEGDVTTRIDAERIERLGVPVVQINTGGACHLDARMVQQQLAAFDLDRLDALVIENVGNLVCPAEFDLGEHDKVMLLSVTEGHDKPRKYPVMFHVARAMVVSKIDLLPYTDFDLTCARRDAARLNLDLEVFPLSARSGEGMAAWTGWLEGRIARARAGAAPGSRTAASGGHEDSSGQRDSAGHDDSGEQRDSAGRRDSGTHHHSSGQGGRAGPDGGQG